MRPILREIRGKDAFLLRRCPLDNGMVDLAARWPCVLKTALGLFALRKDNHAGRVAVEAMDDEYPVSGLGVALSDIGRQEEVGGVLPDLVIANG